MQRGNLLSPVGKLGAEELTTLLAQGGSVRVERIVSRGHCSPDGFWYDQAEHEYVLLVAGRARLEIEGEPELTLGPGDWINLPAHVRHRVNWTDSAVDTVWLAVFYADAGEGVGA
jgi:cupin 2 domain-containing protein